MHLIPCLQRGFEKFWKRFGSICGSRFSTRAKHLLKATVSRRTMSSNMKTCSSLIASALNLLAAPRVAGEHRNDPRSKRFAELVCRHFAFGRGAHGRMAGEAT